MSYQEIVNLFIKELESRDLIELRKSDIQSFLLEFSRRIYESLVSGDKDAISKLDLDVKALNIISDLSEKSMLMRLLKVLKGFEAPRESLDYELLQFMKSFIKHYFNVIYMTSISDAGNRVLVKVLKPFKLSRLLFLPNATTLLKIDIALILHVLGFIRIVEAKIFKQVSESVTRKTGD